MEKITLKIDLDVDADSPCDPCKDCVRELKDIKTNWKLPDIEIPKGFSLLITPDYNSANVLGYYHIDILDRKFFRKFPHSMEWKCPKCGRMFKKKGNFKKHIAKEYKIPVDTVALIDDAMMQKK